MVRRVLLLMQEQEHGSTPNIQLHLQIALSQLGWQVQTVGLRHGRPSLLKLLAMAHAADVLLASDPARSAQWAVLLGLLANRPRVIWMHGPWPEMQAQKPVAIWRRWMLRWRSSLTDLLVFDSRTSQNRLLHSMPGAGLAQHVVIHPPAPAFAPASPRPRAPSRGTVMLGFVGRLAQPEGTLLLKTLALLPPQYQLTIVTDEPPPDALQKTAAELGLCGRLGHIDRIAFVRALPVDAGTYRHWQATLVCSNEEGYPLVALESLAAGVPCLGPPLPALQEMLGRQAAHWLAPENSPGSLAQTIEQALQSPVASRRAAALAIGKAHDAQHFAQQWHARLLRCIRQPWPGPKTVHFVSSQAIHPPEWQAYEQHLAALGHQSVLHRHPATVPQDADIVWWLCGRVSRHHSHRLRQSLQVHEYPSASLGRWPLIKDIIKQWRHPLPDHRVFLNEWVRERFSFEDGIPCSLRDMGVAPVFLQPQRRPSPDHDLVYSGDMGRLQQFMPALQALSQSGLRLLLIGQLSTGLNAWLAGLPGITAVGPVAPAQVPGLLLRARAGLNLMPRRQPLTRQAAAQVLEYLATGLPVLSNAYAWSRQISARYPGRVVLMDTLDTPEAWTHACRQLPAVMSERGPFETLSWAHQLANLPVWEALGLAAQETQTPGASP